MNIVPKPTGAELRAFMDAVPEARQLAHDESSAWEESFQQWRDTQTVEGVRKVVLVSPHQITMRPVRWLWDHRVPVGELTIAAGRAGIGKSQAMVWMAAQVSRGTLAGHHYGQPGHVLYIATEDSLEHTVVPRLHAAGADLDRIHLVKVHNAVGRETALSLALDLEQVRQAVIDTGAVLVVFDALVSGMAGSDLNKAADVRKVLEPLSHLAHDTGAALVGLAHFKKSGGGDPLAAVAGSSAFGEVVRAAIGFAADPEAEDGSCVLSPVKANLAPGDVPSLRYTIENAVVDTPEGLAEVGKFVVHGESDTHVRDLLGDQAGSEDRTEVTEAAAWLTDYLTDNGGSAPRKDVLKAGRGAGGFSEATLKRAKDKAKVSHESSGFPRTTIWSLDVVGSVGSLTSRAHCDEPTEPTGRDLRKQHQASLDSVQSAQAQDSEPTGQDSEPTEQPALTEGSCRACGKACPEWLLAERGGHCITCSRKATA